MNHEECRRATWQDQQAVCPVCGEHVAERGSTQYEIALRSDLGRRPRNHDRLAAYGLGNRARVRGKDARRPAKVLKFTAANDSRRPFKSVSFEAFVYCPNRACGRGMHVEAPSP